MASNAVIFLFCVAIFGFPVPLAQFIIGVQHSKAETRCIPGVLIHLIGSGASEFIAIFFFIWATYIMKVKKQYTKTTQMATTTHPDGRIEVEITKSSEKRSVLGCLALGYVASIIFFLMGVASVFGEYNKVQYIDMNTENYCEKNMFHAAFIMLIIICVMAIPFVVAIPWMFCKLCCTKFVKEN